MHVTSRRSGAVVRHAAGAHHVSDTQTGSMSRLRCGSRPARDAHSDDAIDVAVDCRSGHCQNLGAKTSPTSWRI